MTGFDATVSGIQNNTGGICPGQLFAKDIDSVTHFILCAASIQFFKICLSNILNVLLHG